jgi:hypothetical protein
MFFLPAALDRKCHRFLLIVIVEYWHIKLGHKNGDVSVGTCTAVLRASVIPLLVGGRGIVFVVEDLHQVLVAHLRSYPMDEQQVVRGQGMEPEQG